MKNQKLSVYIAISVTVMAMLMLTVVAFTGGLILAPYFNNEAQASSLPASAPLNQAADDDVVAAFEQALVDVYDDVLPSVVNIQVTKRFDLDSFGFDHPDVPSEPDSDTEPEAEPETEEEDEPREFFDQGGGSGFVWDKDGHIITNYHVINGATEIQVIFADDTTVEAEVVGSDPDSDLAVIKVDLPASYLKPVSQGDSDALKVGQFTIAVGSPFGQDFTMTSGIVSGVGRTIRSGNSLFSIPEVIQTDASINPGNSGGPLLNRYGEVIGINTQIISRSGSSSGIGFAVPINIAKRVAPTLIEGDDFNYAWLGISGRTLDADTAEQMNIPTDTKGAIVLAVAEDGPAAKAGLQGAEKIAANADEEFEVGGDVITAFNGQPVHGMDDLITYLVSDAQPGDEIELAVIRVDGKQDTVTVILGTRPDAGE